MPFFGLPGRNVTLQQRLFVISKAQCQYSSYFYSIYFFVIRFE